MSLKVCSNVPVRLWTLDVDLGISAGPMNIFGLRREVAGDRPGGRKALIFLLLPIADLRLKGQAGVFLVGEGQGRIQRIALRIQKIDKGIGRSVLARHPEQDGAVLVQRRVEIEIRLQEGVAAGGEAEFGQKYLSVGILDTRLTTPPSGAPRPPP